MLNSRWMLFIPAASMSDRAGSNPPLESVRNMRLTSIDSVNNCLRATLATYQSTSSSLAISVGRVSEYDFFGNLDGSCAGRLCDVSTQLELHAAPARPAAVTRARTTATRNRVDSAKALDLRASIAAVAVILGCCTLFVGVWHVCLHSCDMSYDGHLKGVAQ
jgi:hypothetical protein